LQKKLKPTGQSKTATKKQKHYNLRYEMETANKKITSQLQLKNVNAAEFCPTPQQQKHKH
jgi:hypothetical protein